MALGNGLFNDLGFLESSHPNETAYALEGHHECPPKKHGMVYSSTMYLR